MFTINYTENYYAIDDHKMYSKYYKNGTPTVLFEAGLGDSSDSWNYIQDKISLITSTFSYDRAGIGKSEGSFTPRNGLNLIQDLSKLITEVSIDPPFLLVGHSFGGLISRLFACINSDSVVGMILIDAALENKEISFQKILTDNHIIRIKNYLENPELNSEKIDKVKTYKQISIYKRQFDFPLTIITRGLANCYGEGWPEERLLNVEQKLQLDIKNLSKMSKSIIAKKSGHYIHKDEPELVIKEIIQMINQVK